MPSFGPVTRGLGRLSVFEIALPADLSFVSIVAQRRLRRRKELDYSEARISANEV
jgi:hypothetical protein